MEPLHQNLSPYPLSNKNLRDMQEDIENIHTDIDWYIGCMYMAVIMLKKRETPEVAMAASQRFNPRHMRNLGNYICESGEVEWHSWPEINPAELTAAI